MENQSDPKFIAFSYETGLEQLVLEGKKNVTRRPAERMDGTPIPARFEVGDIVEVLSMDPAKRNVVIAQIEITSVYSHHLLDIGDDECLDEGIQVVKMAGQRCYRYKGGPMCNSARRAYFGLLNKLYGADNWRKGALWWVYNFKLKTVLPCVQK